MGWIDAHVHVWSDDRARYPWVAGAAVGHMDVPRFEGRDVLAMIAPHGFERAVLVQSSWYGEDHRCLTDEIALLPTAFCGIGVLDPSLRDIAGKMRSLARQGVRGFRVVQLNPVDQKWAEADGYAAMFRFASEEGLVICPLVNPAALPSLARMCGRFPEAVVVVDHLARVGAAGVILWDDVEVLASMARQPNVFVKVSGFWALGKATPPYGDLVPMIRRVWEAFGAARMMWASDGPYGMTRGSYTDAVALVRERLDFLSGEEQALIFGGTAGRVFFGE